MMFETIYQLRTASDETYRGEVITRGHVIETGCTLAETVAARDAWERRASSELGRPVRAEVWANDPHSFGPGHWSFRWVLVA